MAEPRSGLPGFQVTTSEIKIKEAVGEGGFKTVPSPPVAAHVRTDKHCAVRIPTAGKASGFVCSRRVGSTPYCTPYLHLVDYFLSTPTLCLRQSLYNTGSWSFYSDSDIAGCPEAVTKRRSQLGYVALNNGCPIVWSSKVTRREGV